MSDETGSDELKAVEILVGDQRFVPDERVTELEAERDRLREALQAMLSEFNEGMAGIVHDELAAIAKARAALEDKGWVS